MNMKNLKFLLVAVVTIGAFSCAKNSDPVNDVDFYDAFDMWVEQNHPHLEKVEDEEGLYWKLTKNSDESATKPNDSTYVTIEYSAQLSDGTYMLNSDKLRALLLGTFSYRTNYDDPFTFQLANYGSYYGLTYAHYLALQNMSVGDEIEIAAAPAVGYNYTGSTYLGFGGEIVSDGTPSITTGTTIIKMKLVSMSSTRDLDAQIEAFEYASKIGYDNRLDNNGYLFIKWLERNENEADSIHSDTTIYINYTGRFLDGFVFDTNVAEVAEENNIYSSSSTYEAVSYTYDKSDTTNYSNYIPAFKHAISVMRLGDKVELIVAPEYAYGSAGGYKLDATLIYTETPLRFTIEVINAKDEDDE